MSLDVSVNPAFLRKEPFEKRWPLQRMTHAYPLLACTTIGSFPQTIELQKARAAYTNARRTFLLGEIDHHAHDQAERTYRDRVANEIHTVMKMQHSLGLDILVHGEPERNDMVQYFAEQLNGMITFENAWVRSYDTRWTKPPWIHDRVKRNGPLTLEWTLAAKDIAKTYATPGDPAKPLKGMLTGPTTLYNWSRVSTKLDRHEIVMDLASVLHDEIMDLERAGITAIQIDEPALLEQMPTDPGEARDYLTLAVDAFNFATKDVADTTTIFTHLCYGDFSRIIPGFYQMNADVYHMEFANNEFRLLPAFIETGFSKVLGVGVAQVKNPRVETVSEIQRNLDLVLDHFAPELLMVTPDCGWKTCRTYDWPMAKMKNMVEAVRRYGSWWGRKD